MIIFNFIGGFMYIFFSSGNKKIVGCVVMVFVFIWNGFYDIGLVNMGYVIIFEVFFSCMCVCCNVLVYVFSYCIGLVIIFVVFYFFNDEFGSVGFFMCMGFIWVVFGVVFIIWGWFYIFNVVGCNVYEIDQFFESKCFFCKFDDVKFDEFDNFILSLVFKNFFEIVQFVDWVQSCCI